MEESDLGAKCGLSKFLVSKCRVAKCRGSVSFTISLPRHQNRRITTYQQRSLHPRNPRLLQIYHHPSSFDFELLLFRLLELPSRYSLILNLMLPFTPSPTRSRKARLSNQQFKPQPTFLFTESFHSQEATKTYSNSGDHRRIHMLSS